MSRNPHRRALAALLPGLALALAAAPALTACDATRPVFADRARTVLGPIPLEDQVAYVDSALDRVVLVDLSRPAPAVTTAPIGRQAIYAVPSPDRRRLFVITRGEEAVHVGEIDQAPALWVIDVQHPEVAPLAYAIGSPFDHLALSPDGSTAVAYFSATGPDAAGFFRNPNELALVDLARPPSDANPTLRTIRSFGAVPTGVVLSPPMAVPGAADPAPRTFAFVLAANVLTVLDASHPARREVSIRLDAGAGTVTPRQVVFAPGSASAYVRSDGAGDVLQVALQAVPAPTADANDFTPLLAELGAGGGPTALAVYDDAAGRRRLIAATPSTGQVALIDADTAQFRAIAVPAPIDRILLFPSSGPPARALLASVGAHGSTVWSLDLAHVDDPLTQVQLERIELNGGVRDVVPVPARDLALVVFDDAREVLGLLDLQTRSTSPVLGVGRLDSYDFTPDGATLIGAAATDAHVGFLALANLHPTTVRLDDAPARVLATAGGKVFVDHGDPLGRATVLPSTTATRADAVVLDGFLATDLLGQAP